MFYRTRQNSKSVPQPHLSQKPKTIDYAFLIPREAGYNQIKRFAKQINLNYALRITHYALSIAHYELRISILYSVGYLPTSSINTVEK